MDKKMQQIVNGIMKHKGMTMENAKAIAMSMDQKKKVKKMPDKKMAKRMK